MLVVIVGADAEVIGCGGLGADERGGRLAAAWILSLQCLVVIDQDICDIMMVLLMSAKLLLIPDSFHLMQLLLIQGATDVVEVGWLLGWLLLDLHVAVVLGWLVTWSRLIRVGITIGPFISLQCTWLLLMRLLTWVTIRYQIVIVARLLLVQ